MLKIVLNGGFDPEVREKNPQTESVVTPVVEAPTPATQPQPAQEAK